MLVSARVIGQAAKTGFGSFDKHTKSGIAAVTVNELPVGSGRIAGFTHLA
jgi:hypothetical protein